MTDFDPVRWTVYLTLGPLCLGAFFLMRSLYLRALILFAVLIFVDGVFLSWRHFYFLNFSLSSAVAYTLFGSMLLMPDVRRRMPAFNLAWGALIAFALLGVIIGAATPKLNLTHTFPEFQFFYFEALLYFWIGRSIFRDPEETRRGLTWLVIFAGVVALFHLASLVTGLTFYTSGKVAQDSVSAAKGLFRYGAVFSNPNTLADFYAMLLPAALVLRLGWVKLPSRSSFAVLISSCLIAISLPLTASRGGAAATVASCAIAFLLLPLTPRRMLALLASGIAIAGVGIIGVTVIFPDFFGLTLQRFEELGVQSPRLYLWRSTLEVLFQNPLGVGLHYFSFASYIADYGITLVNPHNVYLGIAVETGFLGLLAFLTLCVSSLGRALRARHTSDPELRTVAVAVVVMLSGFLIGGITEPIFSNGYKLHHLFCFLLGLASFLPHWMAAAPQDEVVPVEPPIAELSPAGGRAEAPLPLP